MLHIWKYRIWVPINLIVFIWYTSISMANIAQQDQIRFVVGLLSFYIVLGLEFWHSKKKVLLWSIIPKLYLSRVLLRFVVVWYFKFHFVYVPCQWETLLQCNVVHKKIAALLYRIHREISVPSKIPHIFSGYFFRHYSTGATLTTMDVFITWIDKNC